MGATNDFRGVGLKQVLVLHGPNLNLLGSRESNLYGAVTLDALNDDLITLAMSHNIKLECKQTNAEHELIELVHQAKAQLIDFVIINAAAFTHSSIALRDAMLAVQLPFIEVHLSNLYAREEYRKHSYLADIANGIIMGLGATGYKLALQAAIEFLNNKVDIE
jgi:3-dehydroquinate dehydratase-2